MLMVMGMGHEVGIGSQPGQRELIRLLSLADLDVEQAHLGFGFIDFNPQLRRIAWLRRW